MHMLLLNSDLNSLCQHILNMWMFKSKGKSTSSSSPASLIDPWGGWVKVLARDGGEVSINLCLRKGNAIIVGKVAGEGDGRGLQVDRFAWLAMKTKAAASAVAKIRLKQNLKGELCIYL